MYYNLPHIPVSGIAVHIIILHAPLEVLQRWFNENEKGTRDCGCVVLSVYHSELTVECLIYTMDDTR